MLVKKILDDFCACYTPVGTIIYVGDTDEKWAYFEKDQLTTLGVVVEEHGKMPDVVVYHRAKKWLVLIEAVTSHGPVNPKRHAELKRLFDKAKVGLVFVTAFLDRKTLNKYLGDIACLGGCRGAMGIAGGLRHVKPQPFCPFLATAGVL